MRKIALLLLSSLHLYAGACCYQPPLEQLVSVLKITGMEDLNDQEPILDQINTWAQKNLLRREERWDIQTNQFEKLASELKPLLAELGFMEMVSARRKNYQGAIVHGASIHTARMRILHLDSEWRRGVRFPCIYFLTGDRPLADWEKSFTSGKTEKEMMYQLWNELDISPDMKEQVSVHFIASPMKLNPDNNKLLRPTTIDNVKDWIKTSPAPGNYLAVSNAPYILRQDFIIKVLTSEKYNFETIGPSAQNDEKIFIFLDELARLIHCFKQLSPSI